MTGRYLSRAQDGEDKIIRQVLRQIGPSNRIAVEFGAKDGLYKSNTARLREQGWRVILFDVQPEADIVIQALITRENINDIFASHGVPEVFDVLSIDIDGNDLWVWDALQARPRIVVIEYNASFPSDVSVTVPYDPDRMWDGSNFYGASVLALCRLGRRKGYSLFAYTKSNLIFVERDLITRRLRPSNVSVPRRSKREDTLHREWQVYA
jgi:hypothetical protein